MHKQRLVSELQTRGLRIDDEPGRVTARKGGAGPSDHRAVTVDGTTVMVPVHTHGAKQSPFRVKRTAFGSEPLLFRDDVKVGTISLPPRPRFYDLETADGIPYRKIAQLHSRDVLATTVFQNCYRYPNAATRCQFCAIGESLSEGRTIARKTPAQLAEVADAAQRLDGVSHMVITTGTPRTPDRGAAILADSAAAVKERTGLPIQVQCEPPDDFAWFQRLADAGADTLGMHLEAFDPNVRARIMPGKAEISVEYYMRAYEVAVTVFGRAQVSTYILAGLGDDRDGLLKGCARLIDIGVYPFVVPFVPITGTPLENRAPPSAEFMMSILGTLGKMLCQAGMTSETIKAGCGRCAACSSLSTFEEL